MIRLSIARLQKLWAFRRIVVLRVRTGLSCLNREEKGRGQDAGPALALTDRIRLLLPGKIIVERAILQVGNNLIYLVF